MVRSAAFSPDGQRFVTASEDNSARIWDAATGQLIAVLEGHTSGVRSAAFSPDGRRIVTASLDGTARIWDVSRIAAMVGPPGVVLIAALARGVGWCTDRDRADLLMQDAAEKFDGDLLAEACKQLGGTVEDREIAEIAAGLRAPLHPNCYLSPTQFAEKFGLAPRCAPRRRPRLRAPQTPAIRRGRCRMPGRRTLRTESC